MFRYDSNGNRMPIVEGFKTRDSPSPPSPEKKDKKERKTVKILTILFVVVAVVLLGCLIWHYTKREQAPPSPVSMASPPAVEGASMGYGRRQRFGFRFY